jgi:hypothetical protein
MESHGDAAWQEIAGRRAAIVLALRERASVGERIGRPSVRLPAKTVEPLALGFPNWFCLCRHMITLF